MHVTFCMFCLWISFNSLNAGAPGPVAQSVASLTADPGVESLIRIRSHTFVEINHGIISTVILLLPLIQEVLLSVTSKSIYVHEVHVLVNTGTCHKPFYEKEGVCICQHRQGL